jgi:hypothetical protein
MISACYRDGAERDETRTNPFEFRIGIHLGDVVEESDGDLILTPNYPTGRFSMAAVLVELWRLDEARAEVEAGLALNPYFNLRRFRAGAQTDNPVYLKRRERIIEDMRKAGVPEG